MKKNPPSFSSPRPILLRSSSNPPGLVQHFRQVRLVYRTSNTVYTSAAGAPEVPTWNQLTDPTEIHRTSIEHLANIYWTLLSSISRTTIDTRMSLFFIEYMLDNCRTTMEQTSGICRTAIAKRLSTYRIHIYIYIYRTTIELLSYSCRIYTYTYTYTYTDLFLIASFLALGQVIRHWHDETTHWPDETAHWPDETAHWPDETIYWPDETTHNNLIECLIKHR